MKEILKNYWYVVVIILVIFISYFMINISNDEYEIIKEEIVVEEEVKITDSSDYYVDIKGEVKNPGVYEISRDSRIVDQTTTIMIQKLKPLFVRKPLISKEI